MDEYAPQFQATIFAAGKLRSVLTTPWREFAHALTPIFIVYDPASHSWYQGYLPVYAMIRAFFLKSGIASITNPLLASLSVVFVALAAKNIRPSEKNAPMLAMFLLISSPQFLITSMTGYTMPAHLFFNLTWIYCYTSKNRIAIWLLPIIGVIALGIHNPFVHGLFVAPFLLRILRERNWKFSVYVSSIYLLGCLFWYVYWKFIFPNSAMATNHQFTIFSFPGKMQWIIQPINFFLVFSWQSVAIIILTLLALRNWRKLDPLGRDLFWGFVITFSFYFFFKMDQGHGWGYRYIYGVLGNLVLLALIGWYELREAVGFARAFDFLIITIAFALLVEFPIRAVQAHSFVRPYARAMHYLQSRPEPFVLLDHQQVWYSQDLVRNNPFLDNRPKIFFNCLLSKDQRQQLAKMGAIHQVESEELMQFGLVKIPSSQE